ncbi:hypothetical protein [Ruoffia sp. FAM 26255]
MAMDCYEWEHEMHKDKWLSSFYKQAAHFYTQQERIEKSANVWAKGGL